MNPTLLFLVLALVIIVIPMVASRLLSLKGLVPLAVVQILVGIAMGPSVFGRVAPEFYQMLANPASLSAVSGVSTIAILLFGLTIGLHLGPDVFRDKGRFFSLVAAARIGTPMVLGFLYGFWILVRHPEELPAGISSAVFATAIAICIAMTALPVLGAILHEMGLLGSRIGDLALGVAGVNDATLWIVLSVLLTAKAGQAPGGLTGLMTLALVPLYLLVMVRFVPPMIDRMVSSKMESDAVGERALAVVGALTIASAVVTEAMGLHYIIGAFIAGAVTPMRVRKPILDRLQMPTIVFLMPFFFASTGLRLHIDPGSSAILEIFLASTVVSVLGIFGGTAAAARFGGASWSFATALGALLQSKGLMELIVLTTLLDAGIVSVNVFAALVLMGLVSTALTMPLTRLLLTDEAASGGQLWPSFGPTKQEEASLVRRRPLGTPPEDRETGSLTPGQPERIDGPRTQILTLRRRDAEG
jgi:Kef-type K+ transport system membrane component KefB